AVLVIDPHEELPILPETLARLPSLGVVNKIDVKTNSEESAISEQFCSQLTERWPHINAWLSLSAKHGRNIEALRMAIKQQLAAHAPERPQRPVLFQREQVSVVSSALTAIHSGENELGQRLLGK